MDLPKVFLSSRIAVETLRRLRQELHARRERGTSSIWVPELAVQEMQQLHPIEAEVACLRQVGECQGFVGVLDGSYGSDNWDITEISILEVEIFMAALSRIPIKIFLLEPFDPDPRIAGLLDIVKAAFPEAVDLQPKPRDEVREAVLRFCDRLTAPHLRFFNKLLEVFARRRSPAFRPEDLDVQFLEGEFNPPAWGSLDVELIRELITRADTKNGAPEKLIELWKAVRCLTWAPYRDRRFQEYHSLWDEVLGRWSSASSWYGLHGHLFLGRLAAVNSLIEIRRGREVENEDSIQGTYGAVASEYYSIAKRVFSWRARRRLLTMALDRANLALEKSQPDNSGLLAIRGSVHLRLGALRQAVRDYEQVLRIRLEQEESPARIGEAEVELALGCLWIGQLQRAEELFESGIAHFRAGTPGGLFVRALRKLSLFYFCTLRWKEGRLALAEAYQVADELKLHDQMAQIRRAPGGRAIAREHVERKKSLPPQL